jgi:hypothetical protein
LYRLINSFIFFKLCMSAQTNWICGCAIIAWFCPLDLLIIQIKLYCTDYFEFCFVKRICQLKEEIEQHQKGTSRASVRSNRYILLFAHLVSKFKEENLQNRKYFNYLFFDTF